MIIIKKVRTAVKDAKIFLGFSKTSSMYSAKLQSQGKFSNGIYLLKSCRGFKSTKSKHVFKIQLYKFEKEVEDEEKYGKLLEDWRRSVWKFESETWLSFGFRMMCFCLRQILSVCWLELTHKLNVGSWSKLPNKI